MGFSIALVVGGCGLPHDAADSWTEASRSGLHVGTVLAEPDSESARQVEQERTLIDAFAKHNGMETDVVAGRESDLVRRLRNHELHVVAGAFDEQSIWKSEVTFTTPYDGSHVLMVAPGENRTLVNLEMFLRHPKGAP